MKTSRSPRRRAREFAVQGLYQLLLTGGDPRDVARQMAESEGFGRGDQPMFERLWAGTVAARAELDALLAVYLDRAPAALSPIEHAILLLGAYELQAMIETPYRVVINEAVELAKVYGGTDGHKYVNGVLDKLAAQLRRPEIEAARLARAAT
ncbi:MAG: transcription antitermination factor NusB [Betaproteobacteria bacterium]|nr:transcription antitermination factor NusB [Betaproteobacteria bacterium]